MAESNVDMNTQLFVGLISSLSSQAYMQMGKLKNPVTDKIERDLQGASLSIDIISMLKEKSAGNLSDEEQHYIDHTLKELRLNFVAEKDKPEPAQDQESPASDGGEDKAGVDKADEKPSS
ncbi:MAG: DUF1844 domain-containing protein [FCB group bacterium]|nr:DUF1844 domain-containing protein [FCB group bacterium]